MRESWSKFGFLGWHGQRYPDARALAMLLILSFASAASGDSTLDLTSRQTLQLQIALEREGFSPGILDAKTGPKVLLATNEFQRRNAPNVTGTLEVLSI